MFYLTNRHCLWFVGNGATLANSGSVWAALICNMKERGYYFDAVQNQSLATTILKVHIELNKIEDLLTSYPGKLQSARWKVSWEHNHISVIFSVSLQVFLLEIKK